MTVTERASQAAGAPGYERQLQPVAARGERKEHDGLKGKARGVGVDQQHDVVGLAQRQ